MIPTLGLRPDAIALDEDAVDLAAVIRAAAIPLAAQTGLSRKDICDALAEVIAESACALSAGVAVPHAAVPDLPHRAVALVRTRAPLHVDAPDGAPVDLFFVVLYPAGDSSGHLQLLAHLAGLSRSRALREGLRAAASADEILSMVTAAEARLGTSSTIVPTTGERRGLAIISVSGERAADTILVGLLREELSTATIVDAQTIQDAASREVPLFAGFRDLFGDPGGRRVIFAPVDLENAETLATIVREACEEERTASADLMVVPLASRWTWTPQVTPTRQRTGH